MAVSEKHLEMRDFDNIFGRQKLDVRLVANLSPNFDIPLSDSWTNRWRKASGPEETFPLLIRKTTTKTSLRFNRNSIVRHVDSVHYARGRWDPLESDICGI